MRFKDKVALVVGAGSGIGASCTRLLCNEGATVLAFDRDAGAAEALAAELNRPDQVRCVAVAGDALSEADARETVALAEHRFGRLDILVNAVGGSTIIRNIDATIEEISLDEWSRMVSFNMQPAFLFCRAAVPLMKRQQSGKIVNISSLAATGRNVRNTAYAAAKAGVSGLTRKLARELGPFGIHCNEIAPSRTLSPRVVDIVNRTPKAQADDYLQTIPLRRLATPEDQARVVCFLASSDADYVTGVTIDVTGGQ